MKRTLVYAAMTGGFGSLAQVLPVLESLDPASHRVVFSIAHGAAHAVRKLGYEFIPYPEVAPPDAHLVVPKGRQACNLDEYWGRFGFGDDRYLAALVESRLRIIERLQPDILLTQFCPPTELIARITGIPLVCLTQSCWHPRGKPLSWWHDDHGEADRPVTAAANAVLARHGGAPIDRIEALNQGDLTLIPSFPEFDPIDDAAVRYLGPMSWQSSAEIAAGRDGALARSDAPLIVVYTGHLFDSGGESGKLILDTAAQALANCGAEVVIATGLGQPDALPVLAANIRVCDWLPLQPLLERCALFIHHGGHGSCMAGIIAAAPALVIPTFQEREFNARQLHSLGLGDFIAPADLSTTALRDKVRQCLNGFPIAPRLREWSAEFAVRRYGGGALGARLIEAMAPPG